MKQVSATMSIINIAMSKVGDLLNFLINHGGATKEQAQCIVDESSAMSSSDALKKNGLWSKNKTEANNVNSWRSTRATIFGRAMKSLCSPVREETGFSGGRGRGNDPVKTALIKAAKDSNRKARKQTKGVGSKGHIKFELRRDFDKLWVSLFKQAVSSLKKTHKITDKTEDLVSQYLDLSKESTILCFVAAEQARTKFRENHNIGMTSPIPNSLMLHYNKEVKSSFLVAVREIRADHKVIHGRDGKIATNDQLVDQFCLLFDEIEAHIKLAIHNANMSARKKMDLAPRSHIHADIVVEYNNNITKEFKVELSKLRKKNLKIGTNDEIIATYLDPMLYEVPTKKTSNPKSKPKSSPQPKVTASAPSEKELAEIEADEEVTV